MEEAALNGAQNQTKPKEDSHISAVRMALANAARTRSLRFRTLAFARALGLVSAQVHVLKDRCKGCNLCIEFCPKEVLEESEELNARGVHPPRVIDIDRCCLCDFCSEVCPDFAIFTKENAKEIAK